jgi:transposase
VFEDEFGVSYAEETSFTWAPKGHTPILKRLTRFRRETSTFVGLTSSGQIYKRHFDGSINAQKVVVGLSHLSHHIRGPWILIWDRSQAHRARIVQAFLKDHPEIQVEYLPPYAPELNPEEYVHGNIKRHLKNGVFRSKDEIRYSLNLGFSRLRKRPDILLGCFHHAGLDINQFT